jgi:Xaa-Pro aminopeptidase
LTPALAELRGKKVRLDPATASAWYFEQLQGAGAEIVRGQDPVVLPRACKNAAEIEGARRAHARDGAAVSRFLHWIATEGQSGKVAEIEACQKLESLRAATGALRDLSFDSISGAGPNGAIVHYRVSKKTNRRLARGALFLIDSGGQYLDGTTDITRTVPIGRPTKEMKDRFTRVLKGHIALARIRFPKGTTGHQLDALARVSLWEAGLDYDHGTGHGVGSYLGVHEGPQRIAKFVNTQPLEPGMIVSNEPGYYRTGAYGIRIENLQVVTPAADIDGGERPMLGFETLTLAPIARELIVKQLLSKQEIAWVNAYHGRVWEKIGPQLDGEAKAWLEAATAPL